MPSRKEVLKMLSALPLGAAAGSQLANGANRRGDGSILSENGKTARAMGDEAFRNIGVEPVINCRGTFTIIGGSLERPQVRQAMDAASQSYVQYDELAEGIARRPGHEYIYRDALRGWKQDFGGCLFRGIPDGHI